MRRVQWRIEIVGQHVERFLDARGACDGLVYQLRHSPRQILRLHGPQQLTGVFHVEGIPALTAFHGRLQFQMTLRDEIFVFLFDLVCKLNTNNLLKLFGFFGQLVVVNALQDLLVLLDVA